MCPVGARCARLAYVGCPMIAETRIVGNKPRWVALWVALLMLFAAWGSAIVPVVIMNCIYNVRREDCRKFVQKVVQYIYCMESCGSVDVGGILFVCRIVRYIL